MTIQRIVVVALIIVVVAGTGAAMLRSNRREIIAEGRRDAAKALADRGASAREINCVLHPPLFFRNLRCKSDTDDRGAR
jgi:glycerate-2-kinase